MAQDINFAKRGEYSLHIRKFFLYPKFWLDITKSFVLPPTGWQSVEFDKINTLTVPNKRGLYAFVVIPQNSSLFETRYLFYIGKTNRTLKIRFKDYFKERDGKGKYRYFVREMLKLYEGHIYFYFLELNNKKDVDENEEKLLNTWVPFVNTDIPEARINPDLKSIYKSN